MAPPLTSPTDLKNTSDDAIPNYLNSLKFEQIHTLTDVRLGLGYAAFFVAAACFLWDYQYGFDSTKYYSAAAVVVYTILNSALTLWMWLKEGAIIYVGTAPNGETVRPLFHSPRGPVFHGKPLTSTPHTDYNSNLHHQERAAIQPHRHPCPEGREAHHPQAHPRLLRVV